MRFVRERARGISFLGWENLKAADKMRYKIPVGIPLGSQGGKRTALSEFEETKRSRKSVRVKKKAMREQRER